MSTLFITCAKGLEELLRDELTQLGLVDARATVAGVYAGGGLEAAYRVCLYSRLASRVLLPLAQFAAGAARDLHAGVQGIDWSTLLAPDGSLTVDANLSQSALTHSQFAAQTVKDAIVDQFRDACGVRPSVDREQPDVRVNLHVRRDQAALSLDLSGAPLHQRGWRLQQGAAPLKENVAAAMLLRARWPETYAAGGVLFDPMCGAGTLLIEAALMSAGVAPGLTRVAFGFERWRGHDAALWQRLRAEAEQSARAGLAALRPLFHGRDRDPAALAAARGNAQRAGVSGFIQLERGDVAHMAAPVAESTGLLISNPPYGERLGEMPEVLALYRTLGERLRAEFGGWRAALLFGEQGDGHMIGLKPERSQRLYNGALACNLLQFSVHAERVQRAPAPLAEQVLMLVNRLRKREQHLRKRLQREGIDCYRIYDADLPEYAAAIDVYLAREVDGEAAAAPDTVPQRWLHVQAYQAPAAIEPGLAARRLQDLLRAAAHQLEVPRARIALKTRARGHGGARYGRLDARAHWLEVREGGLHFRINLFDYLDTGLFLDHRNVRARLRALAAGQQVLNLFAYTGTGSVYAAAGGALGTTSVDLSATYLEWATWNLLRNGFRGAAHRLVQADARMFLAADTRRYGLIYVDTPTFSNSKRADDFDVQRDHVDLLRACAAHLTPGGVIVFSNNFRRFRLDADALAAAGLGIEDWSQPSVPFDFTRRSNIHGCWLLRAR
ncbi:bifunctional 23S rRNA (guanine(2069)-N(7))-methyltransferase RlmK/23S rRNA (guanine(2445)-N(2))-methyltransferase RlmL [Metallibacterium sp.]